MIYEDALEVNALLKAVGMRHRARASELIAPLGLSIGQEQMLLELDRSGPSSQAQLAAAASCEPPTVTIAVRKLEAAGLITRAPSATDARALRVELTAEGRSLMTRLRSVWCELAEEATASMTADERAYLLDIVGRVSANLAGHRGAR
jgi:DNA-binding MarR family transcriptional regulator